MTKPREKRANAIQSSIGQILYRDWNPIGIPGLPDDEYDSYVAPIYRILIGSRSEDELMHYLFRTAREIIGVECGTAEHFEQMRAVARKLLELDVKL